MSSRYGGRLAIVSSILVLAAAGGCGGAEQPAPPATADAVDSVTGVTTPAPEASPGTQPVGTSATVPTSVPVATEPSSAATTTQAPTTTTEAVAGSTAPSTGPTVAGEGVTTTTEVPPATVELTTTTTEPPTTTTTGAPTTTAAPTTTTAAPTTTTTTEPAVDASAVYTLNCVTCHNDSGEGGTGADLRQSTLALAEITSVIIEGRGKFMPGWGDILTAAEIEAVALYVEALQE